ncbi:MAG: hypothetical protein MI863_03920 [Desulfobacterales bacterium]|nr:hypothetical protein [Desulfobacterales bacterium]
MFSACEGDKDQYSGLSELVAERHEARKGISEKNLKKKKKAARDNAGNKEQDNLSEFSSKEEVSTVVLYEKQIDILDSESRIPLAKGVAYMNKKGQIVRIKIINTK